MICLARANTDPTKTTCSDALPRVNGRQVPCACGVAAKEAAKGEETRVARTPDSAREEA